MVDAEANEAIVFSGASCMDEFWGFKRPGMGQLEDSRLDEVTLRRNLERPKCQTQEKEKKMEGG